MTDVQRFIEILPHRFPFLMVDRVVSVEPGRRAEALKCVSAGEPFFQGHFPGHPVMPGVLVLEAMAQVSAIAALSGAEEPVESPFYLAGMDRVRFRRQVRPGDVLRLRSELVWGPRRGIWGFSCSADVDGARAAQARLMAALAP